MTPSYTQDRALIAVTTPLGKDQLLLTSFSGQEEMSRLFSYRLEMLSPNAALKAADLVGKSITWEVRRTGAAPRYFNGIVNRLTAGPTQERGLRYYRAEVVPWLWFLTRTADCRIFQQKKVPDILDQLFKEAGFPDYKLNLRGTYQERDYCVQYRETDFDFVSRLMEFEGIFYYFSHENGKHTLVLADQPSAYKDCPEASVEASVGSHQTGQVTSWEHDYAFRSGKWTQTDYNFETPSTSLLANTNTVVKLPDNTRYEIFDYPGDYLKKNDGDGLTKVRMQEEETPYEVVSGTSTCATFTLGGKFALKNYSAGNEVGPAYVLTSVKHSATEPLYSPPETEAQDYGNSFTCIPATVPFRPARVTPKAVVRGPQTAVVVGTSGEEIYTDKYGRVKVQFFWDRLGKKNENSSCWIRVAQGWAGKNWGMIFTPRIGQEVIVDFLEGDPDRPIVTGRVYNAEQMPPYALTANQTQSGVLTRSSKGGGAANANELRFEDKKDSEEIYFHAEKDFNRVVENNDTLKVGFDKKDKGDQTVEVFNNQTVSVGAGKGNADDGSQTLNVYKDRTATLETGNETLTVKQGKRTVTVETGDDTHNVNTGNRLVVVKTGNDTHNVKTGNREVTIDTGNDTLTIKVGNQTTKLNAGQSSTEAMQSIELKVGANSIKIDQTGITIKGIQVKVQGDALTQIKAPMTQVNGDGMLTLKGGITMIN